MKRYRLKFNYYEAGLLHAKGVILEFNNESRYYFTDGTKAWLPKSFVEKNPDIFELIEEPQEEKEEVIECFASRIKRSLEIELRDYKLNKNDVDYEYIDTPARLILNPKKKKEYVRYLTPLGLRELRKDSEPEI